MASVVAEQPKIPLGDQAILRVTILPYGANNALRDQRVQYTEVFEHFECGRMKCGCPEIKWQSITCLKHRYFHPLLGEIKGCGAPARSGTGNQYTIDILHHRCPINTWLRP